MLVLVSELMFVCEGIRVCSTKDHRQPPRLQLSVPTTTNFTIICSTNNNNCNDNSNVLHQVLFRNSTFTLHLFIHVYAVLEWRVTGYSFSFMFMQYWSGELLGALWRCTGDLSGPCAPSVCKWDGSCEEGLVNVAGLWGYPSERGAM